MKTLLISTLSLLLFSCSSPDNKGQIESLKVLQTCTIAEFHHGSEKLNTIEYRVNDRSQPDAKRLITKYEILLNSMKAIDSLSAPLMNKLNSIRGSIVKSKLEKEWNPSQPATIEYTLESEYIKSALPTDDEIGEIITSIEAYRNELCRIIIEKIYFELFGETRVFVAPEIALFKNEKQKIKLIDTQLQRSEIYEDDMNGLKMIMDILTKKDKTWRSMLANDENWIDQSMSLLSIQELILWARTIAFSNLQYRISFCGESTFTKVVPIIIGSSNALPNDTVQFQVFLGGYNEYSEPEIKMSKGGRFLKNENGKCFIETVVPTSGEIEVNGELLYSLKNGSRRHIPWSHKINVIKPSQP